MNRITNFNRSKELSRRAHELIPAGAHTYSKGDDQFPQNAPGLIARGQGCRVWDVDGNEYLDWGMGLRSVILGHAYPRVIDAVMATLPNGSNFTRPAPIEIELAELLVDLIPSAQMVKFAKNGSDVTSAAIRLARAFTGRDKIALCKENPFFSFYDWFIGTTPPNAGIPSAVGDLSLTFHYNDIASLQRLFGEYPNQIAGVILEPVSTEAPHASFLEQVRDLAHANGAVVIFDEMISGFRWHLQGAQKYFNVTPDLSTFGKAIGNGFSVSVLVGQREIMELGGLHHAKPKVFLLSATHGAETHALAASIATINELRDRDVVAHTWKIGRALQDAFNALASEKGLADYVTCAGYPCSPFIVCRDKDKNVSLPLRTLFLQETIAQGVLMPYIAISYSHDDRTVQQTLEASANALEIYRRALQDGVEKYLVGPAVKPVFRRFN
jgi:glutamate-1-semialdehyde 2,1-aminomutase